MTKMYHTLHCSSSSSSGQTLLRHSRRESDSGRQCEFKNLPRTRSPYRDGVESPGFQPSEVRDNPFLLSKRWCHTLPSYAPFNYVRLTMAPCAQCSATCKCSSNNTITIVVLNESKVQVCLATVASPLAPLYYLLHMHSPTPEDFQFLSVRYPVRALTPPDFFPSCLLQWSQCRRHTVRSRY
jgi:hypothetical protein